MAPFLSAHVGLGRNHGDHEVEQGRLLYFAGENPDDVRARWIAMADQMGFSPDLATHIAFVLRSGEDDARSPDLSPVK